MISSYLNTTVTRTPKNGLDVHGDSVEGVASEIRARLQDSTKRMRDEKGQEYIVDAELWIMPDQEMEMGDFVTFDAVKYQVVRIDVKRGLNMAVDHQKCLLRRTLV